MKKYIKVPRRLKKRIKKSMAVLDISLIPVYDGDKLNKNKTKPYFIGPLKGNIKRR